MGALEIVVLIAGGVIFTLSFLLPGKKEELSEGAKALAREEINALVSQEMDSVKGRVDDAVEESLGHALEKTERSLERLTNEKIMAVNEYSDTVLQEIHKNHEEVMFLYDMLNNKHTSLKNTVSEVNKTVREAEQAKQEAERFVTTFRQMNPAASAEESQEAGNGSTGQEQVFGTESELRAAEGSISLTQEETQADNYNEKILALYRQGKSQVAIARELGLGVGEVRLVIDLFANGAC